MASRRRALHPAAPTEAPRRAPSAPGVDAPALADIAAAAPVGLFLTDAEGRCAFANPRALELAGLAPGDVLGRPWTRLLAQHDRDQVEAAWVEAVRSGEPFAAEARTADPTQGLRWVRVRTTPLAGARGQGHAGSLEDISERRRAEAELRGRVAQLEALHRLGERAVRAGRLEDIHRAALDCLEEALGAERAAVLLLDAEGVMRFRAWRRLSDGYRAAVEGHSPWPATAPDPQPVLVPDAGAEPTLAGFRALFQEEGIGALAFVPLVYQGRLLGKLMLYYGEPHAFPEAEVRLAQTVAGTVATALGRQAALDGLRLYREVFDASHEAIAIIDARGFYTEQNEAHRDLLGYADGELAGKTPAVHLGDATFQRVAEELAATGRFRGEVGSRSKAGQERTLELSAFSVTDEAGRVVRHVVIKRDVTERKRAEEQTKARARQQAAVAALGVEALTGSDPEALVDRAAGLVAAALGVEVCGLLEPAPEGGLVLRAGLGWPAEASGRRAPGQRDQPLGLAYTSGQPVVVEDLRSDARFREAPVLAWAGAVAGAFVPVHGRGLHHGVLVVASPRPRAFNREDVNFLQAVANVLAAASERRRAEDELRAANERLQELGTLKTQLLNTISHELRTPLTPIGLQLDLLRSPDLGDLTERQRRALTVVERNVRRLDQLVREMVDVARLQAGRLALDRQPLDLRDVLGEAAEAYAEAAHQAGVDLRLAVPEPLEVLGDAQRLIQVLDNLLGNALKFTPRGGAVALEGRVEDGEGVVRVRDTGLGFTPAQGARLFQAFSQIHDDPPGTSAGTGLGLFICKGIVGEHGGRVWAESRGPGLGATFAFALPLRKP